MNLEAQGQENEVDEYLVRIYSGESEARDATERLVRLSGESAERRQQTIKGLIKVLDDPKANFETRRTAMTTLGDLHATEAVGVLIRHLTDLEGTTGLAEAWYPAIQALHKIGTPAIPALSHALNSSDPDTRQSAARALGSIGGERARSTLQLALSTERNENVRLMIQIALRPLLATH